MQPAAAGTQARSLGLPGGADISLAAGRSSQAPGGWPCGTFPFPSLILSPSRQCLETLFCMWFPGPLVELTKQGNASTGFPEAPGSTLPLFHQLRPETKAA